MKISRRIGTVMVLILLASGFGHGYPCSTAGVALAAEAIAPATSPVQDVLMSIMQLVAIVLGGLVFWAVKLLADKFKLTISADQQEMVRKAARDAVFYAEEWAAKKYGVDQVVGKGGEQLVAAMNFLLGKIPGLDQVAAQEAIHAALGSIPGLGASGAVGAKM